jgi:2-keto-3-deoxy-L-rhamnonate aldolase RhmA
VDALRAARHAQLRPVRALLYGGADYPQHANDTIVTFAMIETAKALDNLDDILSVEGLDAIYIGPSDLSLSLGCAPAMDDVEPRWRRRSTTSSSAPRRMASSPESTTRAPSRR